VPRRAVNCRGEQTLGESRRWREELRYCRYWPPLTQSVSPVMNAAPSLTGNITALASNVTRTALSFGTSATLARAAGEDSDDLQFVCRRACMVLL